MESVTSPSEALVIRMISDRLAASYSENDALRDVANSLDFDIKRVQDIWNKRLDD